MDETQYSSDDDAQNPFVAITEQPKSRGYRFRYGCEGKTAGSIPGAKSTEKNKTAPAIKLHKVPTGSNALVVVSCVTAEEPYRTHPHKLVGNNCDKGVCTVSLKRTNNHVFQHLGIQCIKKKEIPISLKQREEIKVDPFCTGYYDPDFTYDMKKVRLAVQPFITDGSGSLVPLQPIITNPIHDQKNDSELAICRMDRHYCQAKGGQEVFLLTERISKDDIQVSVFEEDDSGQVIWEEWGDFSPNDVHKQYAIVMKMPPYKDQSLSQPKEVKIRLFKPSDDSYSEPKSFTYKPNDVDPHGVNAKRKRRNDGTGIPATPNIPAFAAFQNSNSTKMKQDILQMMMKTNGIPTSTITSAQGIVPKVEQPFYNVSSPYTTYGSPLSQVTSPHSATSSIQSENSAASPSITGIQYPKLEPEGQRQILALTPNLDELMDVSQASPFLAQASTTIPSVVDQMTGTPVTFPMQIPSTINVGIESRIAQPTDQVAGDAEDIFNSIVLGGTLIGQPIDGLFDQDLLTSLGDDYLVTSDMHDSQLLGLGFDPSLLQTDGGGSNDNKKPKKTRRKTKKK